MDVARPPLSRLGLQRVTGVLVVTQAAVLVFTAVTFAITGLAYVWEGALPVAGLVAFSTLAWLYYVAQPGPTATDWTFAEAWLVLALLFSFGLIAPPSQYAALALDRPPIDHWLAAIDHALGIDVGALTAWTRPHRALAVTLLWSYRSLLPQFFLPVFVLGLWYRDRVEMWEYAFHFHVCSLVTVVVLALWPAACAFTLYGFPPLFDESRFLRHFMDVRAGVMTVIDPRDIEGMVSFPSFHAAGAMMVTWAFRRRRAWLLLLVPLNAALLASTVLSGAHYIADIFGAAVMFMVSLGLWQRWPAAAALGVADAARSRTRTAGAPPLPAPARSAPASFRSYPTPRS